MLSLEPVFRQKLLSAYHAAPLDVASFHRRYKACGKGECAGLCCSGGVGFYLEEEPDTIRTVATDNANFFARSGVTLPETLFTEQADEDTGEISLYTSTRVAPYPSGLLPPHFESTACIFKRDDGACTLQLLGVEESKPDWWYKPIACWLFPIELDYAGEPYIRVAHASTDEYVDAEYPGFVDYVPCGRECAATGKPAYDVLAKEIAELSRWLDRDLRAEIMGHAREFS